MSRNSVEPPALVFRRPVLFWLGELILIAVGVAIVALVLGLVFSAGGAIVVIVVGIGVALVRLWHYRAGAVVLQGETIILRRGFLRVLEVPLPLSYDLVRLRHPPVAYLFGWAVVRARFGEREMTTGLVSHAPILQWVLDRERRHRLTAAPPSHVYGVGRREFELLTGDRSDDPWYRD